MNDQERRLILDRGFDRALTTVLDAFLREGFSINPVGAGDLHRPTCAGHARRYAMFDASLPELVFCPKETSNPTALLSCRVSAFELTDSCTLLTVERPMVSYPALTTLLPQVSERIAEVMRALLTTGVLTAA